MLNTDDLDKGHQEGLKQACEGKKKNFLKLDSMRQQWKIFTNPASFFVFAF